MIDELLKLANSKNIKIEVFVDEDITTSIETMNDKLEKYESILHVLCKEQHLQDIISRCRDEKLKKELETLL